MNINSHLPIQWTSILIIGNRSYRNMGDELILLWTVKLLLTPLRKGGSDAAPRISCGEGAGGSEQLGTSWRTSPTPPSKGGKEQRHITISCYDPKRLKQFFSQFIDTKQITFIHELPKGIRSAFQRLKKGWLKELKHFRKADTVILWWGEILTEENPSAYRYRLVWMRPFLLKVIARRRGTRRWSNPGKQRNLYLMWWIQIPTNKRRKKLFRFLLNKTTHLYLRDFQAVEEIKKFWFSNVDFFMDTSYFAYERWLPPFVKGGRPDLGMPDSEATGGSKSSEIPIQNLQKSSDNLPKSYIIVNLNKNGERFLPDIAQDIQTYLNKGYTIYYVPVAKWHNTYYNDLQYITPLRKGGSDAAPRISCGEGAGGSNIQTLDREENFEHFITTLKRAELVISTRLHLFLIASFLHIPTKVYPYQRKILKMQEVIKKTAPPKSG